MKYYNVTLQQLTEINCSSLNNSLLTGYRHIRPAVTTPLNIYSVLRYTRLCKRYPSALSM